MAKLTFRSPVTKPLLRAGTAKPVPPDPRAYETFRVTQQFGSLDGYFKGQPHNAVDIGNFRCGDPVVAMLAGQARRVKDEAGALGVILDHGHGITSEYWHLNRQDVSDGESVPAGRQLGIVGSTGLGSVCHLHVEVKVNGERIDPEPLMFGGSLETDDMALPLRRVQQDWWTGTGNILAKDSHDAPGGQFFTDGPGVGTPKWFTTRTKVRSIAESGDGLWRLIELGSEVLYMHRYNLRPIEGTRLPTTGFGAPAPASEKELALIRQELKDSREDYTYLVDGLKALLRES